MLAELVFEVKSLFCQLGLGRMKGGWQRGLRQEGQGPNAISSGRLYRR